MEKLLFLALGGATGTSLRYLISGWAHKILPGIFPWGTLTVNLLGSFFIGLAWGLFERGNLHSNLRLFLFVGLFGGFTTFSSFALENLNLLRDGNLKMALLNISISNIAGLLLVYAGFSLSRYSAI